MKPKSKPHTVEQIRGERAKRHLAYFVKQTWHVVEPGTPLVWTWHLDVICQHLEAVTRGDIKRLIINIPPGTMKSLLVSVFWPAWEWVSDPSKRVLFGAYEEGLSLRDRQRCRDILQSEWWAKAYGERPELEWVEERGEGLVVNSKGYYDNTSKGHHMAISRGGKGTGYRGESIVIDDPLGVQEATSEAKRKEAVRWVTKVLPSRLNDQRTGTIVMVMQRVHEEDPAGALLEQGGWVHLRLPMEYEEAEPCCTPLGDVDPRTEDGELLFEEMFPTEVLDYLKLTLGSREYAGQYQQRPAPAEGNIIKRAWLKYYTLMPKDFDEVLHSWDLRFGDSKKAGSFVTGQIWGRLGRDFYLLDQVRGRWSYIETKAEIRVLSDEWPEAYKKLIERKANGDALISDLNTELGGMVKVEKQDSKYACYVNASPVFEAGNVYLPDESIAPWVKAFVHEITTVPEARYDDQADAAVQLINYFKKLWLKKQHSAASQVVRSSGSRFVA